MNILLSPIVGAYYRPPAKTILGLLGPGHELVLDPEPENPYDENAVKVGVYLSSIEVPADDMERIEDELMQYGSSWKDLFKDEYGDPVEDLLFHLGYIPRSGAKTAKIDGAPSVGNLEVLDLMNSGPDWKATITFSPAGQPLVQLRTLVGAGA